MSPLHLGLFAGLVLVALRKPGTSSYAMKDAMARKTSPDSLPANPAGVLNYKEIIKHEITKVRVGPKTEKDVLYQSIRKKYPNWSLEDVQDVMNLYPDWNLMLSQVMRFTLRDKGYSASEIEDHMLKYEGMKKLSSWWNNVPVSVKPLRADVAETIKRQIIQGGGTEVDAERYIHAYQKSQAAKAKRAGQNRPTTITPEEETWVRLYLRKTSPAWVPEKEIDAAIEELITLRAKQRKEDSWWPNWLTVGLITAGACLVLGPAGILAYYGITAGASGLALTVRLAWLGLDVYTIYTAAKDDTGIGLVAAGTQILSTQLGMTGKWGMVKTVLMEVGINMAAEAAITHEHTT